MNDDWGARMEVVQVIWRDTFGDAVDWTHVDDLATQPRIIRSCGYVVNGGVPGHVTLAQSWDIDTDHVGDVLHIPETAIVAAIYDDKPQ